MLVPLVSTMLISSTIVLAFTIKESSFPKKKLALITQKERQISSRTNRRLITGSNGVNYFDYDYNFIDPAFKIKNELARNKLLSTICADENVVTYVTTDPVVQEVIDNPDSPEEEQTTSTVVSPGPPLAISEEAFVCRNSLLKYESFSDYFNNGQYLYEINNIYKNSRAPLLPLFDSLNSIRFHSSARDNQIGENRRDMRQLFYEEALDGSSKWYEEENGAASNTSIKLWGRWAEAITGKSFVIQDDQGERQEKKIENYSINKWLNIFVDYFLNRGGIGCPEVWGDFKSTDYYWNTVLGHEINHHYLSSKFRDQSDANNLPIEYQYYTLAPNNSGGFVADVKHNSMTQKLWTRMSNYFSDLKNNFWDNNPATRLPNTLSISHNVNGTDVTYNTNPSRLAYVYEPEEVITRLIQLFTFYWEDLDPKVLELASNSNYEKCEPSFFLQDFLTLTNQSYSFDPFSSTNFSKALALILEAFEFNKPIARITKQYKDKTAISFQGWAPTNAYQKLVFEEINPLTGTIETKRNIIDLSWSASNFYVREAFNSPTKRYISCTDDYDNVDLIDDWSGSCQMWTTPLIEPNELFDKFFTKSTETNYNISDEKNAIYVGFEIYFWNDINGDGEIQNNEKIMPNFATQTPVNARLMSTETDDFCKISIIKENDRVELWRYIDKGYENELQNIDAICDVSWT